MTRPRSPRVQLAVDLWRAYRDAGRPVPPTWAARSAGATPTAVLAALRADGAITTEPRRGHDGRRWNWSRADRPGRVATMSDTIIMISNGHRFELGDEIEPGPGAPEPLVIDSTDDGLLAFADAMTCVAEGWAVARMDDCARVVYVEDGSVALLVGTSAKGVCAGGVPYQPTLTDVAATDWMLMGFEEKPAVVVG